MHFARFVHNIESGVKGKELQTQEKTLLHTLLFKIAGNILFKIAGKMINQK